MNITVFFSSFFTSLMLIVVPVFSTLPPFVEIDDLILNLKESPTLATQKQVAKLKNENRTIYNWGIGTSPFSPPECIVNTLRNYAHKKQYTPVEGIPELQQILSEKYSRNNYLIQQQNIIVSSGLKQIIFDIQRAWGGEILLVSPYWVSYPVQTYLLQKRPQIIYTSAKDDYKLQPEQIKDYCQKSPSSAKLIIFNHPVNPTGCSYTDKELKQLAKIFEEYGIVVLADEVYLGCGHGGDARSISDYLPNNTIRASSLSKEFAAAGYRLGWAVFPESLSSLKKAVACIGSTSYSCAPVPQQYAAVKALESGIEICQYKRDVQEIMKILGKDCYQKMIEIGLKCTLPKAAWYLLIDFEPYRVKLEKIGITNSQHLSLALLDGIGFVTVPGEAFGLPPEQLAVRASYVDFDGDFAIVSGPEKGSNTWAPKIHECLEALESWIKSL
ncbi:MAG: pyridoxal phosphate-dependent aminotransferase [Chlamydiota bacterium]|nr:pyridoxal phosphate-dependent aminotransferase [Chlamydiota bacterium]